MARQDPIQNVYEDFPDELKETWKKAEAEYGQKPARRTSKDVLMHDHEWHLSFLAESALPPPNLILPPPYPPSRTPVSVATTTGFKDVLVGKRNAGQIIFVRLLTEPYVNSSSIVIAEDEAGDAARLTICNFENAVNDPDFTKDAVLVIKQPCWTKAPDDRYYIRVDHPSDILLVDRRSVVVPPIWRKGRDDTVINTAGAWTTEGDRMFLEKEFKKALVFYDRALSRYTAASDFTHRINLYRKRCGANLVLSRLDEAAHDLSLAISLHNQSNHSHAYADAEGIELIRKWLHDGTSEDPLRIALSLPRSLKDLATRIKFDLGLWQSVPEYDFSRMSSCVGPLTLHIDAANYTCDTEVKQTSLHGRGLFGKRPFKTGDLIMAEKAFALPGYFFNDRSSECSLYSLGDGTTTDRAGALLFKELVRKLRHNLSMREAFFDLDDGGYWGKYGWGICEGDDIPVDIFRIEHIRRRNCFSSPIRSLDLLTNPSPVRNGFWIHSSYVNHACLPNSVRTFIGDMLFLRASRDISSGEEITSQYLAPELEYQERQQKFESTWGFQCDCTLCQVEGNIGQQLERERMVLFEDLKVMALKIGEKPTVTALKRMTRRLRDLEALYDSETYAKLPRLCLVHPTLFLTESWRSLKNMDKTAGFANKLLSYFGIHTTIEGDEFKVLGNAGLINVETVRALKYYAEAYDAKGRRGLADKIRVVARIWFNTITGADVGVHEFMRA